MSASDVLRESLSLFTLRELRTSVGGRKRHAMVAAIASGFAVLSMIVGGMVSFSPIQGVYTGEVIWYGAPANWWYYPEVLIIQPWGIIQLPFLPTVVSLLVAVGAGVGATVALAPALGLLRHRGSRDRKPAVAGVATGMAPGIAALATLGACCCTSCVSLGGLALVAAASGTTTAELLRTEWYLPLFQFGVVYMLLFAQERAMRQARVECAVPAPVDRRFVAGAVLRVALLIAGITWSMSMLVEWGSVNPGTAPSAVWYHWLVEHQLLSLTAVGAALFPQGLAGFLRRRRLLALKYFYRAGLAVGAMTWAGWIHPSLVGLGLGGFVNELEGFLGLPAAWGAVSPDAAVGAGLLFHWAFQHLLLGAFGLSLALAPEVALRPLGWSAPETSAVAVTDTGEPPSRPRPARPGPPIVPGDMVEVRSSGTFPSKPSN